MDNGGNAQDFVLADDRRHPCRNRFQHAPRRRQVHVTTPARSQSGKNTNSCAFWARTRVALQRVGFALKQAQQALRTRLDTGLREIGLTTPQYAVLAFLEVEPGASNAALARRAFVTPQTMQGILVALERSGFIARTPHPEHGRVQTTELTALGRDALEEASGIVADAEARAGTLRHLLIPRLSPRCCYDSRRRSVEQRTTAS
ncbi:MarR family transcriptional regulator [Bradyrhizobium sp. dw_78]|uniref:MarR family winged helix-turn-helix transcriptional regulator n=1 Tax=Bradyrhizobium sp. dw_78 TaxID=2719793 RepID=UPI00201C801C|nr:MarR family transcriptional regulator [Bradyrhizobium sp. dw_78]